MTLPASKTIGDTGHVSDHNAIVAHIASHEADTTTAHGSASQLEAHRTDTTDVHGIADTAVLTGAWTTWTSPSVANVTTPIASGAYRLVGKTLEFRLDLTGGTGGASNPVVTLPAGLTATAKQYVHGVFEYSSLDSGVRSYASGTTLTLVRDSGANFSGLSFATYPYRVKGTIQVN